MTDIIELIDAYAETRHLCGGIYNAKTEAARKAVIEALSGVQALSAAPAVTSEQRRLIGVIADKIEDGTIFQSGIYPKKDLARFVRNMLDATPTAPAASPTPPAEQQAISPETEFPVSALGSVYAALPEKPKWSTWWGENLALFDSEQMRDFADRTHVLRMEQAAPKAAPREPVNGWPVEATIYKRRDEWVLELSGTINDCAFTCRHTQPGYLQPEDVAGLPSLYSEGIAPQQEVQEPFQNRVHPWLLQCFGAEIAADRVERNHRFLEEALELVQSTGCTQSEAHQLVDYVFGRPVGEPAQEVGGVMVTLAALCLANGLDMHNAGEIELARIWTKVEAIRAKQAAKPKHSPLPQAAPQQEAQEPVALLVRKNSWRAGQWEVAPPGSPSYGLGWADQRKYVYAAPQPTPAPLSRDQIREVFMAHGFTIKEGQTDLKQYVYDAAYALLELVAAPQQEAQEPVPAGEYPALPAPFIGVQDRPWGGHAEVIRSAIGEDGVVSCYTADQMRAYVDADRAMRAQQPAATVIKRGADRQWMSERLGALPDGIYSLYLAPQPAPAPLSEREAFEAWIEKDGGDLGTFGTPPNMHYRNSAVNNAWVAWKARAALAAQGGK